MLARTLLVCPACGPASSRSPSKSVSSENTPWGGGVPGGTQPRAQLLRFGLGRVRARVLVRELDLLRRKVLRERDDLVDADLPVPVVVQRLQLIQQRVVESAAVRRLGFDF